MDKELLVDDLIEDGRKLIAELVAAGFDVSVAFWVKTSDEGFWFLYIGSTSVEPPKTGDAYRRLYACLVKIPLPWLEISRVKLVQVSNPIAQDAIAARERQPVRPPHRFRGKRLGNLSIEDAYIYPRVGGPMTPGELLQTLVGMANRPSGTVVRPSAISLRDGTTVTALITGFNLQLPGGLTIHTLEPTSKAKRQLQGDEVVSIQI